MCPYAVVPADASRWEHMEQWRPLRSCTCGCEPLRVSSHWCEDAPVRLDLCLCPSLSPIARGAAPEICSIEISSSEFAPNEFAPSAIVPNGIIPNRRCNVQRPLTGLNHLVSPARVFHILHRWWCTQRVRSQSNQCQTTRGKPKHDMHHVQASAFPWMHARLSRGQGAPMPILERTRLASFGASLR